jgi:cytochrome c-type biogenesis protein
MIVPAEILVPLDIGDWAASAMGGTMALAIPVALLAGLVSFFSPCVVPLLPGYLSYTSGLGAADVIAGRGRLRMLAGTSLFVLGIAVVFVSTGAVAGGLGGLLFEHQVLIGRILGAVIILLGLIFAGVIRIGQRDLRIRRVPAVGVAAAPLVGVVFALGWTPCIGPTLGAVLTLAMNEGTAMRGAVLAGVFALGLGVPFVLAGLVYSRAATAVGFLRRHQRAVMRIGGAAMVAVGLLLVTGIWNRLMLRLVSWSGSFVPGI